MKVAVIPARGGSKRILRKNIKEFCGQPMIAYAVNAAMQSGLFDHVIVSTDDDEIARIANEWGAETPFVRPARLSDDFTATVPVIAHAIMTCQALGWELDDVCCIYPGVPFIQVDDLKGALECMNNVGADYCFPITQFPSAIQRALRLLNSCKVQPFHPEYETTRTQDLEAAYYDAGQFYWGRVDAWLGNRGVHSNGVGYIIPSWRVVDIDTMEDWERAERFAPAILYGSAIP